MKKSAVFRLYTWCFAVCALICLFGGCKSRQVRIINEFLVAAEASRASYGVDITITPMTGVTRSKQLIVIAPEKENITYILSGHFYGQIEVRTKNTRLLLNGVFLEQNRAKPALLCKAKTEVAAAVGTENYIISTGKCYKKQGALHAKRDLLLTGSGTLYISGSGGHGLEGDDIQLKGTGSYHFAGSRHAAALSCETLSVDPFMTFSAYFQDSKNGIKADKRIDIQAGTFYLRNNHTACKTNTLNVQGGTFYLSDNKETFVVKSGRADLSAAEVKEE